MHLADAVQSSRAEDAVEIGAAVLLGLVCLFLMWSGFKAHRKAKGAKGSLRLVGGSALLVLVGFAVFGPAPSAAEKEPVAKPTATVTTQAPEQAKKFATCEEADGEFDRLYRQLLDRGAAGDVAGMTATAETQFQTTVLNDTCFSKRGTTAVSEVLDRLKADPLPVAVEQQVSETCRAVVTDSVRLLNTAILRKDAGDDDAATRLGEGFARLGAANETCLPQQAVDDLEQQLEKSPLGKTADPQTP